MKRNLLLVTLASMLACAMALSWVAQAAPVGGKADAKCLAEAVRTLPPGFNPSNYTFHGGTQGDDAFEDPFTAGPDVFCGFGGDDSLQAPWLDAGDIFLGGAGNDTIFDNFGTFYGGEGNDRVHDNDLGATFNGGPGDDSVINDLGGIFVQD